MSRKGKQPIAIPKGVEVNVTPGAFAVKGPKGSLSHELMKGMGIRVNSNDIEVFLEESASGMDNFHGLFRAIVFNMVQGVSQGFEIRLEMIGVGYRASVQGNYLDLQIGLSHPTKMEIPEGIQVKVEKNIIIITGINKQRVGQFAASVRAKKPPEPYQGKGIRYVGEYVRKKAGKAAAKK